MQTKNPRLTITLEPSTAAQLDRMSELTGNSKSSMIAELLTNSSPVFERMIKVLEAAQLVQQEAKQKTAEGLERAQAKIEKQLGLMLDWMDDSSRPILEQAEKVQRRGRRRPAVDAGGARPRTAGGARLTPPSNRGVRSTHKTGGKQATMRVPGGVGREKSKPANPTKKPLGKRTVKGASA
uniref:Uncharacterized protein n=1 Tax=uncultured prokaryote TaxID=198431 RepID=A0A0H5PZD6_9ZZZZ|nr:hypothetical protein [uncultured prokaryote]